MRELSPISKIAEVISGYAFKSEWFGSGKDKIIRISDLVDQQITLTNAMTFDGEIHKVPEKYKVKSGDILMALSGATTGKIGVASKEIEGAYVNQRVAIVRGYNETNTAYLTYILQSSFVKKILDTAGGAAQPNMSPTLIEELNIPIPDEDEQYQIASKLKAIFNEFERARNASRIIKQDIKRLKHLSLKDFLSDFLETEKFKLGEKAVTTSGSTPSRSQKDYWESAEIPWIKTGEIAFAPITKAEEYVSAKALKECSLKLLPVNTVLIAMYGQGKTRGQSAILKVPATINQACFAILPNETWNPEFLQLWLMYSYQDLRSMSENRGGNQANLNGDLLNSFEVPAPLLEVQREIVSKINMALAELDIMQESWKNTTEEINTLPNRLLAQAFNEIEND